jgi:3-hydroxymyristoyl/3-hydroxydecanoyl-(acyl carrier protein) dehydratase
MPGVLIVEALAQVGAVAVLKKRRKSRQTGFFCWN